MPTSGHPHLKLLLFDIDGTVVDTARAGIDALEHVVEKLFGKKNIAEKIDVRGRTDTFITYQILEKLGLEPTHQNVHDLVEAYLQALGEYLPRKNGEVLTGILDILEQASRREDLLLALLTGNLQRGAQLKLEHYNVWHFFEFGAFGDGTPNRNDLGAHALRLAEEKHGAQIPPERIYVIGDTPHDIECGNAINANTIAVATGGYSVEELRACQPTHLFEDFSDTQAFFKLLEPTVASSA